MTSQLNVDTIVDKAGSGGTNVKVANTSTYVSDGGNVTQNTVQALAKVWCNYDGTGTVQIDDSLNTASITDSATGTQTITFTNSMANTQTARPTGSGSPSGQTITADITIDSDENGVSAGPITQDNATVTVNGYWSIV